MWVFLAAAVAGGLGAVARFLLDGWLSALAKSSIPVGTFVINVTGSFALGVLAGASTGALMGDELQHIAGAGFLGGYTTFSTASEQTAELIKSRRPVSAVLYAVGTLGVTVAAAAAGMLFGAAVL